MYIPYTWPSGATHFAKYTHLLKVSFTQSRNRLCIITQPRFGHGRTLDYTAKELILLQLRRQSMASGYGVTEAPTQSKFVFGGTPRNLALGFAMFAAAALAFSMNLTDVFFAKAVAWIFVLWGILFLYIGLMDLYQVYEVTDEALIIRNPMRPWAATKVFDWPHVHRMDIVVKRRDAEFEDAELQVYYTPEGEISIEREDRAYNPTLAAWIIERAELRPTSSTNPTDFTKLPQGKATYIWNKSGRIAAS
jgi:hypothetical protein